MNTALVRARVAPIEVQRRWAQMLAAPPPAGPSRLGAPAPNAPRNWYDLVQSAKARGESYTAADFDAVFPAVRQRVLEIINSSTADLMPPPSAAEDVAHIVIAWMWQRLGNVKIAADPQSNALFIDSALLWMALYGKVLEQGKPSMIRWDAIPWSRGLQGTNLKALDWDAINAACQNLAPEMRLGGYYPPNPPQNINWPDVDWQQEDIPGTVNLLWASVPWAGIPWGDVNWSVVNLLPAVFWKELGPEPRTTEYKGSIVELQGRLLSPTALVLARLSEMVPGAIPLSKIPSSTKPPGWTPVGGQIYVNKDILTKIAKTKVKPPFDDQDIIQEGGPPGGRPPTSDKDESKGTTPADAGGSSSAAPADSGTPTWIKVAGLLAVGAVAVKLLSPPPRRRRRSRR